jgi:hypothetical protein
MGKLCLGQTNTRKANTQWEWRDGKSSVYLAWQEAGRWCICALGWREPGLVLRGRLIPERPTHNGSKEMARVVCTLRGKRLDGGVSVLSVGVNPVWS